MDCSSDESEDELCFVFEDSSANSHFVQFAMQWGVPRFRDAKILGSRLQGRESMYDVAPSDYRARNYSSRVEAAEAVAAHSRAKARYLAATCLLLALYRAMMRKHITARSGGEGIQSTTRAVHLRI